MIENGVIQDTWRTFVAVDLPPDAREALAGLVSQIPEWEAGGVRWVRPEGIHLTLSFLGETAPDMVPAISDQLAGAASNSGAFTLHLADVGAFPSLRRPRVLWTGLSGETTRLRLLHARVQGGLSLLGFEPERRRFDPHLTVGRIRRETSPRDARYIGAAFEQTTLPMPPVAIPVRSIVLFRSHLKPGGAEYERIFEAPLS